MAFMFVICDSDEKPVEIDHNLYGFGSVEYHIKSSAEAGVGEIDVGDASGSIASDSGPAAGACPAAAIVKRP
ncbi:hypothetical protein ACLOJK_011260 [Asimina triloba]